MSFKKDMKSEEKRKQCEVRAVPFTSGQLSPASRCMMKLHLRYWG